MQPSSSGHAPLPSSRASKSSTLQNMLKLITKITVEDISSAERCGSGGFGDVYMLTHPAIGKLALKRVRVSGIQQEIDSQLRRAAREAETWRGLEHPNILPFFDVLERSGCLYLVSPFVQNGSIVDFIRRHPDVDRARLIQEAAAGVAYIHRCGIIHGDIKGANILVSDDVRALLCDFGLAREQQINTSTAMQGIGTVRWQSPELLSMARKTFKSDSWAFAMTISEVLSGNFPYHECVADTAVIIAVFVLKQRPRKEPATSPTGASYDVLWDVATECWHDEPDQRPEMQEVYDRLILGSFRSLLLSPPPRDDEDTPKDAHVASPTNPSPPPIPSDAFHSISSSPDPSTLSQAPVNSGLVESRIPSDEPMTITVSDLKRTVELQTSLVQHSESTTAVSVKPRRLPTNSVLGRHGFHVWAVGFSPDGKTIASGSRDQTLQLWDVEAGHRRGEPLKGHTGIVSCLAFSPDGTTIATGSSDKTVRLWDVKARNQNGEPLRGHTETINCLAFSPDGTTIATGSDDKTIRLWDVEARNQKGQPLKGHTYGVTCVAFAPDGTTIASGSFDQTIRLWNTEAGTPRGQPLPGYISDVYCLGFSPDGTTIASGSLDHTIRLWNVEAGSQRGQPLVGHTSYVWCLAFSPDGATIASGSPDKTIRLWDVEAGIQRGESLKGHTKLVFCLSFSPDGMTIVSGSEDGTIRLWAV